MPKRNMGPEHEYDIVAAIDDVYAGTDPSLLARFDSLDEAQFRPYDAYTRLRPELLMHHKADKKHAVAVFYPFAVGRTAYMRRTLENIQDELPDACNIVGFPSNTGEDEAGTYPYSFNEQDLEDIKNGAFHSYLAKSFDYLTRKNIRSIDVIGIEQGASIAVQAREVASQSGVLAVRSACLIEPPNVIERHHDELLNAIKTTPTPRALRRVNPDEIRESLAQTFPHIHGKLPARFFHRAKYQAGLDAAARLDYVNEALLRGLSRNQFGKDCRNTSMPITLLRGSQSEVCPTFDTVEPQDVFRREQYHEFGKEIIYSPLLLAKFAARAIERMRQHTH